MITPLSWLERNPTYKEQMAELREKDVHTFGFLGYPVLQTADIIMYKANCVPVGVDQAPHLELSREITRRFNHFYGEVFPEPKTMLAEVPKALGTDGRKMSKSYNNAVFLSDTPEVVTQKLLQMVTDTARKKRIDAGNPDVCPVFITFHVIYSDESTKAWVRQGCQSAGIGCIECKKSVIPKVIEALEPIRQRRLELEKQPEAVKQAFAKGNERARAVAVATMAEVKKAMKLSAI
jgi:tryptophanyl-tRNA synthetase